MRYCFAAVGALMAGSVMATTPSPTDFARAIERGDVAGVQAGLATPGLTIDDVVPGLMTPLSLAVQYHQRGVVELLLAQG